jgi:hypothetical protein
MAPGVSAITRGYFMFVQTERKRKNRRLKWDHFNFVAILEVLQSTWSHNHTCFEIYYLIPGNSKVS